MKRLFLLRHAKSSWADASLADFDRPLNERGRRAAPLMGALMRREGFEPDAFVSSPAARAKTTAEMVREAGGSSAAEITFDDRIYDASPARLREVAAGTDDKHQSVMLVGHNPGMESFVSYLTAEAEPMPTAALAVIDLEIGNWSEITADCGRLVKIYRPKEVSEPPVL